MKEYDYLISDQDCSVVPLPTEHDEQASDASLLTSAHTKNTTGGLE